MSAKAQMMEELRGKTLTRCHGRRPTAWDIEQLEEDVAQIATEVKTSLFQGGQDHGCLAAVISEEEYRLEIMDNTFTYVEPLGQALPAYNPNITGEEDDYQIKALEAEHKVYRTDRLRYEGLTEHIKDELLKSVDETWLAALKRPRGGYANIPIKRLFEHLRNNAAKLSTKDKKMMAKELEKEWDQTQDITTYFRYIEDTASKLDRWDIDCTESDMVTAAVDQMIDSGIFERTFLRNWEKKTEAEKTWEHCQEYFGEEYVSIKTFDTSAGQYESINEMKEATGDEIKEYFDEWRRDTVSGQEQISQMAASFKGATATATEIMARLKSSQENNRELVASNKQLADTNKMLVEIIKSMGGNVKINAQGVAEKPEQKKCPHCNNQHKQPFDDHCWKLEKNKDKRPRGYKE